MNGRRIKALIVKEFLQVIRDPSSIMIAVVLPLILLFVYGFGVSLDSDNIPIGLVLQENGPEVTDFTSSLRYSRFLKVREFLHIDHALEELEAGTIRGIVVIPTYFTRFKDNPDEQAQIQVIADGSIPNTAAFVQNYVNAAWANWLQQLDDRGESKQLPLIRLQPRFWYNEDLDSRNFLIPGTIAIIMTLIGTLLTALVIAREWERGTMEALMATPVTIGEILVGKLIPYFCLGIGSMVMCTLIAVFFYEVPLQGSLLSLFAATSAFLCAALGIGLFISTAAKNQFVASQMAVASAFLPAFILSGFIFEISSMPIPIRWVTNIVPARYFVSSLKTIFLVGSVWEVLVPNLLKMIAFAAFLFFIIQRKTVKRLD